MSKVLKVLLRVQTDRQTDRPTDRQTDRQTGRQADRPTNILSNFQRPFVWNAKGPKNAKITPSEVLIKVTHMKNAQERHV